MFEIFVSCKLDFSSQLTIADTMFLKSSGESFQSRSILKKKSFPQPWKLILFNLDFSDIEKSRSFEQLVLQKSKTSISELKEDLTICSSSSSGIYRKLIMICSFAYFIIMQLI